MKLLIDLGNTRLKWALWNGTELHPGGAVVHAGNVPVDFAALWKDVQNVDAVFVASVAGRALEDGLAHHLRDRFGVEPRFPVSVTAACGVRNAYAQPERLGVDRFLGLIAAHAQHRQPTVIAGCGTALTLDALATDGRHLGGLIAPSPALMRAALRGNTARLAVNDEAQVVEVADNTADAIESGTRLAGVALIERFVAQSAKHFDVVPALILTGGGAQGLAELITLPHRIEADLVLRGLVRFVEHGPGAPSASTLG
ncbi:MAG: type III pantothenate kinase [Rudaea sp.]|nr:type III pantothenate kinase [Rudaea sp.]